MSGVRGVVRAARGAALFIVAAVLPVRAGAQATQPRDTVLLRAQRLVTEGQGAAGRALVDTVLAQAQGQGAAPRVAEALFWRAALAEQAASAERDYTRVTVEYALSPWSGEALLRLGQLAYARGERTAALRSFARLVVEQAETPLAPVGLFWKGRVLLEQGDVGAACEALREATRRAGPDALELRNQVEFYAQRCREVAPGAAPAGAAPASTPSPAASAPPAAAPPAAPTRATEPAPVPTWSLQVSAHKTRAEAQRAMRTLVNRGYQARVDGASAPFRVRIGHYPTEAAARKDLARAKAKGLKAATVVKVDAP